MSEELEHLLVKKQLAREKCLALHARLEEKVRENINLEQSLISANELAAELTQKAALEAERILSDAEAKVALSRSRQLQLEKEIAKAEEELANYRHLVYGGQEDAARDEKNKSAGATGAKEVTTGEDGGVGPALEGSDYYFIDSSAYTIQLVSFLNARHYVAFGGKQGPVHAHSWQIHIKIKIPAEKSEQIPFAKIMDSISSVISCYEKTVLNEEYPFNVLQPTTENMAMIFFNRLEDMLVKFDLSIGNLSVWETPTKGIEVTRRNPEFDHLPAAAEKEAAATVAPPGPVKEEKGKFRRRYKLGKKIGPRAASARVSDAPQAVYHYPARRYLLHALLVTVVVLVAYYQVVTPQLRLHYPWGSDTWGHLYKAEFLFGRLLEGEYFPQFTEYWYNGVQPFRYWAPLPYYAIALLRFVSADIFMAGNYYVFLCALLGGLSLLFFAGRIGIWQATIAGVVWSVWIDNVRVAFSEGNLPRVLATALLPLLFFLILRILEDRQNYIMAVSFVLLLHLAILCHAMIGAVYCISLGLFAFFFWVFGGCLLRDLSRVIFIIIAAVVSAGWWLLPSLGGGITNIDPAAVKEIVQFVPSAVSLNPFHRFADRETFYWGISLLLVLGAAFASWRSRPPWIKSLVVCGSILIVITFPSARLFFLLMPLSHLLWPLRFSSFAALALILSALALYPFKDKIVLPAVDIRRVLTAFLLTMLLIADCYFSVRLLAYTVAKSYVLLEGTEYLQKVPGWRVATIDLSSLGSAPSYLFSEAAGREQVFGWAWQGATTSSNIMLLNMGIEYQYYPFLLRSCVLLGATDLLVKNDVIEEPENFSAAAIKAGYEHVVNIDEISLWHGQADHPYLVVKDDRTLAIGRHAGTLAIQFPHVEMGTSPYLDRYLPEELNKYPSIVLSGAEWWSGEKAEEILRSYISAGGRLFVELAGLPENVLAKQPELFGVYGEAVTLGGQLELLGSGGGNIVLEPFNLEKVEGWKTYVPQGLDEEILYFDYYGVDAPVVGYKLVEGEKVWFLGGNLPYHTFLTKDAGALRLLEDIFGIKSEYTGEEMIPLRNYTAMDNGYLMQYSADREVDAVIPVAALEGMKVEIDGERRTYTTFENLLRMELPPGEHEIAITLERTPVYFWGLMLSFFSVLVLAGGLLFFKKCDKDVKKDGQISV